MSRRVLLGVMLAVLAGGALVVGLAVGDAGSGTLLSVARAVRFVGIGAVTGLLVLVLAVWLPLRRAGRLDVAADAAFVETAGRALRGFALLGLVGSLVAMPLLAADADDGLLGPLTSRAGIWTALSALAFAGLAVLAPAAVRANALRGSRAWTGALPLLVVLNVAPAFGGNAAGTSPALALVPIEIVHVTAMGAWIGGLLALLLVLPRATRALSAGLPRTGLLAAVLLRFTPVALVSVALLTLAGTGLSLLYFTTLYDLADTAYGRAVFAKVVVLLIVIAIAVLQREYLMPRLERAVAAGASPAGGSSAVDGGAAADDDRGPDEDEGHGEPVDPEEAARHVRLAMRSEALLLVVVLIVTGALAGYPPPKTLVGQPVSVSRTVGGVELRLVVEPARVGDNAMRLSARGTDGRPAAVSGPVRVRAVPPGRAGSSDVPVDVAATAVGRGRWTAAAVPLGARGSWKFEVRLTAAGGQPITATLPVRIR